MTLSTLQATNRHYFMLLLSFPLLTLVSRSTCLEYLDRVKRTIFQASEIVKRLMIFNVLVNLWRISGNEQLRNRYPYHFKDVGKICCLRPTRTMLNHDMLIVSCTPIHTPQLNRAS